MDAFNASMMPFITNLVKLPHKNGLDYDGDIIFYGDNIYRGITPKGTKNMIKMFNSGLISELNNRQLIPKTEIVPLEFPGYTFILKHAKINNISYAFEWSFSMLQDAALMVLDVFELLVSHDFNSKDGHTGNILFDKNRPVWVDLTSFIEKNEGDYGGILSFFFTLYQPLELMSMNPLIARERLKNGYHSVEEEFYLNLMAKFGVQKQKYFSSMFRRYMKLFARKSFEPKEKLIRDIEIIRQRVRKLKLNYRSQWATYQNNWLSNDKSIILSEGSLRFLKINNVIQSLPIKSVIEFAANQGMFSAMLAENPNIEKIVATDNDEQAVDSLYKLLSKKRLSDNCVRKIFPMIVNFNENVHSYNIENEMLFNRTKSDAVVALAMTHHLLLSQHVEFATMFHRFSQFTNRFIFVEFMPLGLWDGIHSAPPMPEWYTEEYFVENMAKYFHIRMRTYLDKNRILFIGELKHQ